MLLWIFFGIRIQHLTWKCLLQIKVREGSTDWGWGVVVNVVKRPSAGLGALPARGGGYIVDTLLHCSPGSSENGARPKPCPPCPAEKGEMHVVSWNSQITKAKLQSWFSEVSDLQFSSTLGSCSVAPCFCSEQNQNIHTSWSSATWSQAEYITGSAGARNTISSRPSKT